MGRGHWQRSARIRRLRLKKSMGEFVDHKHGNMLWLRFNIAFYLTDVSRDLKRSNCKLCSSSYDDIVYYHYFPTLTVSRKTFAIAIFQQIAAFVELAAERAAGTNNFICTVSTNLRQVRINPEGISRISSAQSFIVEITYKMIVVQIKSLQDWQICNPDRNCSSQFVSRNEKFPHGREVSKFVWQWTCDIVGGYVAKWTSRAGKIRNVHVGELETKRIPLERNDWLNLTRHNVLRERNHKSFKVPSSVGIVPVRRLFPKDKSACISGTRPMQHLSHRKNALKQEFMIDRTYHLGQSAKFGRDGPSQIVVGCSSSSSTIANGYHVRTCVWRERLDSI